MLPKKSSKKEDEDCISRNVYKNLAEVAITYLNEESVPDKALDAVHMQLGSYEKTYKLYLNVHHCVSACVRIPLPLLKLDHVQEAVGDLKVSEDAQKEIIAVVQTYKSKASEAKGNNFYPKIKRFRWRIDITISSSVLARVLEPTLLFEVTLCDGRKKVFEVSIAKFHQIRYSVAAALKEIENLKKKKLLKT
ncbi:COMM domain-containing protein 5-like [Bacillus rossius redtenbacheri]|uniref:COMM domain-containing protein 5-like n=1 Tax=Bacillus rossius redtenbacheri TaxID=93214 RepID=UPI002FDD5BFC